MQIGDILVKGAIPVGFEVTSESPYPKANRLGIKLAWVPYRDGAVGIIDLSTTSPFVALHNEDLNAITDAHIAIVIDVGAALTKLDFARPLAMVAHLRGYKLRGKPDSPKKPRAVEAKLGLQMVGYEIIVAEKWHKPLVPVLNVLAGNDYPTGAYDDIQSALAAARERIDNYTPKAASRR